MATSDEVLQSTSLSLRASAFSIASLIAEQQQHHHHHQRHRHRRRRCSRRQDADSDVTADVILSRSVTSSLSRDAGKIYTVSKKKRDQNVFYSIFYKTRAILMKFGTPFPE